jgi:hypothetical protein
MHSMDTSYIMISPARHPLTVLLVALQFCFTICVADEPPAVPQMEFRPDLIDCEIDAIAFQIDGSKLWTLSGLEFQSHSIATRDSAYGTVLNIDGVGLLGTAHFLDIPGQPGKIEKENVTGFQILVDEAPVTFDAPNAHLAGASFRMKRTSLIRAVRLESEVSVRNNILIETVRMQTQVEVPLKLSYPLMYAWSPKMTDYLFGNDSGVLKKGTFQATGEKTAEGLERTARWMAVYDSANDCGAICLLSRQPSSEDVWFQYTDAPGVYRKLRLMSFSEKTMPAGFDGTYQAAMAFFKADKTEWEDTALRRLQELKALTRTAQ